MPSPSHRLLGAATIMTALLLAACGGDSQRVGSDRTTPPTSSASVTTAAGEATSTSTGMHDHGGTKSIKITAKNVAFSPAKVPIPVSQEVEVVFDNRDASVPHNIHFKTPTEVKTDVKEGKTDGSEQKVKLTVDTAGTYEFVCDVHPTMKGELTAS
ncbi:MAG: cupredoxin domain-containing protein [Actinobacteria bacterium]|nr:cupredoxin domain-containing protein [Actinomycetota bacterium]